MAKVIFGKHSAVRVHNTERESIRKFYCNVLGCKIIREFDDKDDIQMEDDFYIAFLYGAGNGRGVDKGVNYAVEDVLKDDDFLKAIFLELMTDNVEEMRQKIIASASRCSMYLITTSTFRLLEGNAGDLQGSANISPFMRALEQARTWRN